MADSPYDAYVLDWIVGDETVGPLVERLRAADPRCPIAIRPVKPVPIATATRPGTSCSSVAIALACTSGCRRLGTRTAGPSAMRVVRCAASAAITQMSPYSAGESNSHARA